MASLARVGARAGAASIAPVMVVAVAVAVGIVAAVSPLALAGPPVTGEAGGAGVTATGAAGNANPTLGSPNPTVGNPGAGTSGPGPSAPAAGALIIDEDGPPRISLPTAADGAAWQQEGFRLELGLVYGRLIGLEGAPSGRLLGPFVRVGLRLDRDWSVFASFEYAAASAAGGLSGLRFAGTIDPTWHVSRHLSLALGFGFGGIVEGSTSRSDPQPLGSTLDSSYTFPNARTPLPSCSGVGAAGLARAQWSWVLGPRSSTSVALEVVGQWTGCVNDTGVVEVDTGQAIVRRQWWPHVGGTLGWGFTWR